MGRPVDSPTIMVAQRPPVAAASKQSPTTAIIGTFFDVSFHILIAMKVWVHKLGTGM